MQAIAIGPLIFAGGGIAAIIGIGVFLVVTSILGKRVDPRLGRWANVALIAGLIAARLGHVVEHASSFAVEPWRVVAIWQGGFSYWWGLTAAVLVSAFWTRSLRFGLWVVFASGASLAAWNIVYQLTSADLQTPLPTATFERLDGRRTVLGQTDGKPIVINLWASWCPPCRREMPLLAKVAARRHDVAFLLVNQGEDGAKISTYLASSGLSLSDVLLDPLGETARHYRTPGLPSTLFVGSDGKLRSVQIGEISPEALDENITRLLGR
jgi:thiol-disulfide isomerase/thioredoxin